MTGEWRSIAGDREVQSSLYYDFQSLIAILAFFSMSFLKVRFGKPGTGVWRKGASDDLLCMIRGAKHGDGSNGRGCT